MNQINKMEAYSKYEKARIIGARALQISQGAPFMIKFSEDDLKKMAYSTVEMAKLEFAQGLIPIGVRRPIPGIGKKENTPKPFDQTKLE